MSSHMVLRTVSMMMCISAPRLFTCVKLNININTHLSQIISSSLWLLKRAWLHVLSCSGHIIGYYAKSPRRVIDIIPW